MRQFIFALAALIGFVSLPAKAAIFELPLNGSANIVGDISSPLAKTARQGSKPREFAFIDDSTSRIKKAIYAPSLHVGGVEHSLNAEYPGTGLVVATDLAASHTCRQQLR
jgi:hypothetical protein